MKKKKNAFTLIELLAIIVILAIIAVITVPIILNIIENSRKGAASDSAYGYKDAVNKYYVTELSKPENQTLILSGKYDVSTGGVLDGSGISNKEIPVSGDKPSAGELHYTNNTLQGGCLVIGDYQVIFDGGSVSSTTKGNCSDYDFNASGSDEQDNQNGDGSETQGESEQEDTYSMTAMCPGCVFANQQGSYSINYELTSPTTNDYSSYGNSFLGVIVGTDATLAEQYGDDADTIYVKRVFACGIENGKAFCLEGLDNSKYSNNVDILKHFFPGCEPDSEDEGDMSCSGSSIENASIENVGEVSIKAITYTVPNGRRCSVTAYEEGGSCDLANSN